MENSNHVHKLVVDYVVAVGDEVIKTFQDRKEASIYVKQLLQVDSHVSVRVYMNQCVIFKIFDNTELK